MMKDYEEVAKNVLRRGLEERARNQKRKRVLVRGGCAVAVCGLAVAVSVGVFLEKARPDAEEPSAGIVDEGGNSGKDAEGFDPDGGQGALPGEDLTGKDSSGMDGNPAGYGTGAGKDAIGYPGGASDDAPVPGGKTDGMTDGIEEGQLDPESTKPAVENSYPAWTQNSDGNAPVPDADHPFSSSETAADVGKPALDGAVDMYDKTGTMPSKEMISSYPEDTVYCYMAPGNGEFFCSAPVAHAMEEYGDEVLYRVVVDVFRDGYVVRKQVTDRISGEEKLEWDRLGELGYTVAWENYDDGETKRHYFMIYATKEQLEEFAVNEEYGYIFRFFDEP